MSAVIVCIEVIHDVVEMTSGAWVVIETIVVAEEGKILLYKIM
jgi:hypothetical protein